MSAGVVWAVCISKEKGTRKQDVGEALLLEGLGLRGDAQRRCAIGFPMWAPVPLPKISH